MFFEHISAELVLFFMLYGDVALAGADNGWPPSSFAAQDTENK
jgi:hypothetical protein